MPVGTPSKFILYQYNTSVLQILGLQDYVSQSYLDSGVTVVASLVDNNGVPVGELTDVAFTYVAGSNGNYNCIFGDENFAPAIGTGYTLIVDANNNNVSYGHWEFLVEIQQRQY